MATEDAATQQGAGTEEPGAAVEPDQAASTQNGTGSRREAKDRALDAVREELESREEGEQPRDEQGRFQPSDEETEAPEATEEAPEQTAETEAEPGETEATPGEAPEAPEAETDTEEQHPSETTETDVVELDEDHPWRSSRGVEEIPLNPEWDEETRDMVRASINNPVRHSDLDEARDQIRTLRRKIADREARIEALQSEDVQEFDDPGMEAMIEDLRQAGYDERADRVERALQMAKDKAVDDRREQALTQAEQREVAQNFYQTAQQDAREVFPAWADQGNLQQRIDQFSRQYLKRIDQLNEQRKEQGEPMVRPDVEDFLRRVGRRYAQDPQAQQYHQERGDIDGTESANSRTNGAPDTDELIDRLLQDESAVEKLRSELADREAEEVADAASRRNDNPHAGLAGSGRADKRTARPEPDDEDLSGQSAKKQREARKQRVLGRFGQS